jgi:hypothetical protein
MSHLDASVLIGDSGRKAKRGRGARWFRRLLVGIPLLAIVGLLLINVFLMLPPVKHRITRRLSAVLGADTDIGRITWSPWAGVRARNVRIAAPQEAIAVADVPFFESDTAWIKVGIWPLFAGVVDVAEVGIDSPRISCVRAADGRLLLPFNRGLPVIASEVAPAGPEQPEIIQTPEVDPDQVPDPTNTNVEGSSAPKPETNANDRKVATPKPVPTPAARKRSLNVRLGELVIHEGKVTLLGERDGRGLGELRDFQMRLKLSGGEAGAFEASGATVLGKLEFTDIGGKVTAAAGGFEFREMHATCKAGKISGSADLGIANPGTPFAVDLKSEGLKPSILLQPVGDVDADTLKWLDTEIVVQTRIQGYARALNTVVGAMRFEGLQIPTAAVLSAFSLGGSAAERAGNLDFEIAKVQFHLSNGGIVLDDVNFNADRVVVRAAGEVSAAGLLNVVVRTYIPVSAISAIGEFMRGWPRNRLVNFIGLDYTEYIYRDMRVEGTISEPAVDAWNDGTFYTVPALLDEVWELREAGKSMDANQPTPELTAPQSSSEEE